MADGDDMYSALDIAKYIISKCNRENCPISNLQLQKILYNLQKAFLQSELGLQRKRVVLFLGMKLRPGNGARLCLVYIMYIVHMGQ